MKRWFALLLLVVLVMSTTVMAAAESDEKMNPKITEQKALELARETIKKGWNYTIDDKYSSKIEYKRNNSNSENDYWHVSWSYSNEDISTDANVTLDSLSGKIVNAYFYQYPSPPSKTDKDTIIELLTDKEARLMAEKFIRKLNPGIFNELELVSSDIYTKYSNYIDYKYVYYRKVNNAYVSGNYISITVYGDSNKVASYTCKWNELDFQPTQNVINKYQALKAIKDNLPLTLRYTPVQEITDFTKDLYITSYDTTLNYGFAIDAETGYLIDQFGNKIDVHNVKNITEKQKKSIYKNARIYKSLTTPISKTRAIEIMKDYIKDLYGTGFSISKITDSEANKTIHAQLKSGTEIDYMLDKGIPFEWQAVFEKKDAKGNVSTGLIKIDALSERLLHAEINRPVKAGEIKSQTWEEGYDKAIDIITRYYPDKINELKTELFCKNEDQPEYIFVRVVDGVIFDYNGIGVSFDENNYTLKNISYTWDNIELPKVSKKISLKEAHSKYLENFEPSLYYVLLNTRQVENEPEYDLKLAYDLPNNYYNNNVIEASSGKLLNNKGVIINNKNTSSFEPEHLITKFEALETILEETDYHYPELDQNLNYEELSFTDLSEDNPYYKTIKKAYTFGLIDNKETEFKGDQIITREELAEILIKRIGYSRVANLNHIYRPPFSDYQQITDDKLGEVALCYGFGILQTDKGNIKPLDPVNKVDLVTAICNVNRILWTD